MSLPWTPSNSFYSCFMICEAESWLSHDMSLTRKDSTSHSSVDVPNTEQVVVPTASQLLTIWTPFKATNFLTMILEGANKTLTLRSSNIIGVNKRVKRAA